jgi:hypothetical protein
MIDYSPLLAIITGVFEFFAAGFAFFSPGRKRILYPVGLLMLLLAGYQFSEVLVCTAPHNRLFLQLAFFDITWLPPVGLWLAYQLSGPSKRWTKVIPLSYFLAGLAISLWIFLGSTFVTKSVCQVVIARYHSPQPFDMVYGIFYQTGLAVMIFWAAAVMAGSADPVLRKHMANLQLGLLGFVLPSFAIRLIMQKPEGVLPSVMCHFALILAMSLFILILRERRYGLGKIGS